MNYKNIVITILVIIVVLQGVHNYSTGTLVKEQYNLISTQHQYINLLKQELRETQKTHKTLLNSLEYIAEVDVTMYNPEANQTDDTPFETASGAFIDSTDVASHRWIAISRDLQRRWGGPLNFGDKVYIIGTGEYDGIYTVQDNMHSRWTKRIDILKETSHPPFKFESIRIFRISKSQNNNKFRYVQTPSPTFRHAE